MSRTYFHCQLIRVKLIFTLQVAGTQINLYVNGEQCSSDHNSVVHVVCLHSRSHFIPNSRKPVAFVTLIIVTRHCVKDDTYFDLVASIYSLLLLLINWFLFPIRFNYVTHTHG